MRQIYARSVAAAGAIALMATAPAAAQQGEIDNTQFGTTSAEFLLLGAGARGAALGGSFSAVANDVTALYWNPGGLAMMERPGVHFSHMTYVADTRYTWVGLAIPLSGGQRAIGIHGATFGFSDQPVYTVENPEGDGTTYGVSESYFGLTFSQNFSDRFSAGITGKFINDQLGDTDGQAFAVDFGTNFHAAINDRPIRAAFTISNLGTNLQHDGAALSAAVTRTPPQDQQDVPQEGAAAELATKDFGLPVLFRVGVAYDFISSANNRLTVMSEFNQPNNNNATAGGAFEWAFLNLGNTGFEVAARGGYTYQPDNDLAPNANRAGFASSLNSDENLDGLSLGGGLGYRRGTFGFFVDYAYRDLGLLGGTNFFSATIQW
jgi:hypothetical protein